MKVPRQLGLKLVGKSGPDLCAVDQGELLGALQQLLTRFVETTEPQGAVETQKEAIDDTLIKSDN